MQEQQQQDTMRSVHARDFLCCFCCVHIVSTCVALGLRGCSSRGLLYYVAACPVSNRGISFAYIIRRERSPVSWLWHQVSSSMGGNAGRVIANCWRFIDNRRRLSPYSSAPIFKRLSFVSHHLQPFGFSEYEHQLPLGSHTHTHTHTHKEGGFNTLMTHAPKTERYIHCLASITKSLSIVSVLCYKTALDWDGETDVDGGFCSRRALRVCDSVCVLLIIHWNSHWATRFVRVQLVRQPELYIRSVKVQ